MPSFSIVFYNIQSMAIASLSCHGVHGGFLRGPLHGFLGGPVCDPFHICCYGLLHVHDYCHDSCHNHPHGCGSIHGPLYVQSHVFPHGPIHFPSCGIFQSPVLCPGLNQGHFCDHEGNKYHYLSAGRRSPSKREVNNSVKLTSLLPYHNTIPYHHQIFTFQSDLFSPLYHYPYCVCVSLSPCCFTVSLPEKTTFLVTLLTYPL